MFNNVESIAIAILLMAIVKVIFLVVNVWERKRICLSGRKSKTIIAELVKSSIVGRQEAPGSILSIRGMVLHRHERLNRSYDVSRTRRLSE